MYNTLEVPRIILILHLNHWNEYEMCKRYVLWWNGFECMTLVTNHITYRSETNRGFRVPFYNQYERHGVSNHQKLDCFVDKMSRLTTKTHPNWAQLTLWEINQPVAVGLPSQQASYAESVSTRWRRHDTCKHTCTYESWWAHAGEVFTHTPVIHQFPCSVVYQNNACA